MSLSELPEDKDVQDVTYGPPPIWLRMNSPYIGPDLFFPSYTEFPGLGLFQGNYNVNPSKIIKHLKRNQEWDKQIPRVAGKYTKIDPLSPLFRETRAKYGYGDTNYSQSIIGILAAIGLVWFLFFRG